MAVWWLRVHTIVEIKLKPDAKNGQSEALKQLYQVVRYMRMVLHSQPNRRFVFGLLLSGPFLYLFHADRSGILSPRSQ